MSRDHMHKEDKASGYTHSPGFHYLIRSRCEYCGVILVSVKTKLEELEREHRVRCKRARSAAGY